MKCPYCIKICSKCGRLLVANNINFQKHKDCKYGVQNKCKECQRKYSKQNYENNKDHKKEASKKYSQEHREEKREKDKQYYKDHKEEMNKKRKEHYLENKEKELEKNRQYREEHKEEITEQRKQYYKENREKILEEKRKYLKNNPHINFNNHVKRRQLEEQQGNGINKEQWLEMMEFFNWKCAYSGIQLNKDNRSIDHIVPLLLNGEHEIWNCVPMYMPYNSSKNTKNMEEWYIKQDFYSEERLNKIYEWVEYAKNKYQNN